MWIWIIILGVLVVGCIAALITIGIIGEKKDRAQRIKISTLELENGLLSAELAEEQSKDHRLDSEQLKWYEEKVKSFENRISDLNERIEEKQNEIKRYNNLIKDLEDKNYRISIAYKMINPMLAKSREEYDRLNQAKIDSLKTQKDLNEAIQASKTAASECEKDVENLKRELKDLSEQKRLAILYQDEDKEGYWEFSITPKENELISILERIKIDYPELKMDISSIEWRKIWLNKAQDMTNEHGLGVSGIYRLILKSDENVCYVGQAVNIKDRWYQHIKKMIGVDVKGTEKLYNYRPEAFYWTIVEFVSSGKLNDREHYWIEYFGCKEKGLNRKA